MKVIPTIYEGIEYRSKTEASWAAYLTYLGVNFEYEPEAFDLGSHGCYLPDFYLVYIDCFLEIKPSFIMQGRDSPVQELATQSGKIVYTANGQPRLFGDDYEDYIDISWPDGGNDFPYWPCLCKVCGTFGIEYCGRYSRIQCKCKKRGIESEDRDTNENDPRFEEAVKYAFKAVKWRAKL